MQSGGERAGKVMVKFHIVVACETLQTVADKYHTTPEWLVRNNPWIDTYEPAPKLANVRFPVKIEKSDRLYQVSDKLGKMDLTAANCLWPGLLEEYDLGRRRRVAGEMELQAPTNLPGLPQPTLATERQARFFVQTKEGDNLNGVAHRLGTTRSRLHQLFPSLPLVWRKGAEHTSDYYLYEAFTAGVGLMISPQETLPGGYLKSGYVRIPDDTPDCSYESRPGVCHFQELKSDWFEKQLLRTSTNDSIYYPWGFGLMLTM